MQMSDMQQSQEQTPVPRTDSFTEWLGCQARRTDRIGSLARLFRSHYWQVDNPDELRELVNSLHTALDDALAEWLAAPYGWQDTNPDWPLQIGRLKTDQIDLGQADKPKQTGR